MADTNVTMPDKEALLKQEEELEKKNKWLYPVLITVLCLIFTVGFIYGIQLLLNMEGTFPPSVLTEGKTPVPQTNEELADYLNGVVEAAVAAKPVPNADPAALKPRHAIAPATIMNWSIFTPLLFVEC